MEFLLLPSGFSRVALVFRSPLSDVGMFILCEKGVVMRKRADGNLRADWPPYTQQTALFGLALNMTFAAHQMQPRTKRRQKTAAIPMESPEFSRSNAWLFVISSAVLLPWCNFIPVKSVEMCDRAEIRPSSSAPLASFTCPRLCIHEEPRPIHAVSHTRQRKWDGQLTAEHVQHSRVFQSVIVRRLRFLVLLFVATCFLVLPNTGLAWYQHAALPVAARHFGLASRAVLDQPAPTSGVSPHTSRETKERERRKAERGAFGLLTMRSPTCLRCPGTPSHAEDQSHRGRHPSGCCCLFEPAAASCAAGRRGARSAHLAGSRAGRWGNPTI